MVSLYVLGKPVLALNSRQIFPYPYRTLAREISRLRLRSAIRGSL